MIVVAVVNVVAAAAMSAGNAPVEAARPAAGCHDIGTPPGLQAHQDRGLPHGSVQHADDNTKKFQEVWEYVMWMKWEQGCAKKDIAWLRAENYLLKEAQCMLLRMNPMFPMLQPLWFARFAKETWFATMQPKH